MKALKCFGISVLLLMALTLNAQLEYSGGSGAVLLSTTGTGTMLSDTTVLYNIKDIYIHGNRRTRNPTILRELSFNKGDSYQLQEIAAKFLQARQQLMNTDLFRNVVVSLHSLQDKDVYVNIEVEERWYLYPLPFVKAVDNKLSKWWNEKNRRLDQINYGIRLTQKNITGRNDKLFLYLVNGYTKEAMLTYKDLALDKKLRWYTSIYFDVGKRKEISYQTEDNRRVDFRNGNGYVFNFFRAGIDFMYRPAIKTRHIFSYQHHHELFADTVLRLNENFSAPSTTLNYPVVGYTLSYNNVDLIPYPTHGFQANVSLKKFGMNKEVNMWQVLGRANNSWPLWKKSFFNINAAGILRLPFKQPYLHQQFLGNGEMYVQGYEDYVIDGVAGGYGRATLYHTLLNTAVRVPPTKHKTPTSVPIRILAKAFTNAGYVYNPNKTPLNKLNNEGLLSAGLGLDIVLFNDLVLKVDWSFNRLGQNGLYLHSQERY